MSVVFADDSDDETTVGKWEHVEGTFVGVECDSRSNVLLVYSDDSDIRCKAHHR